MLLTFFVAIIPLCSCSKDTAANDTVATNPFDISETSDELKNNAGEDDIYGGGMGFTYSDHILPSEYTGEDLKITFTRGAFSESGEECEQGFIAFLGGVPQLLSLNGGEKSEMVSSRQKSDTEETVTITISPRITEDLAEAEVLQLKLFQITYPSYRHKPENTDASIDHSGTLSFNIPITMNAVPEITNTGNSFSEYESLLITASEKTQYKITGELDRYTRFYLYPTDGNRDLVYCLLEGESSIELDMVIFGKDNYKYRIYFYKNHQRIRFNSDCDYLDINLQSGYLDKCRVKINDIQNRDDICAIAVPLNDPDRESATIKTNCCLILSESDPAYQNYLENNQ